jgi:hypothetical protein
LTAFAATLDGCATILPSPGAAGLGTKLWLQYHGLPVVSIGYLRRYVAGWASRDQDFGHCLGRRISLRYDRCLRWRERISRIRPSGATSRLSSDGELGHRLWSTENITRQGIDGRVRLDRSLPVSIAETILGVPPSGGSTPTPSAGVTSQIVDGVCARHSPCTRPAEPVCRCCQFVNS